MSVTRQSPREVVATRRALFELAREIPMWRLAPLLGVSDRGLDKVYEKKWIDHRNRGDWARLQAGLRVPPLRLRGPRAEGLEVVRFGADAPDRGDGRRDRDLVALLARDAAAGPVAMPEDLRNAHPLVRRGAKASVRGPYLGETNLPGAAVNSILRVSRPHDQRARRFLSAFLDAVEARGVEVLVDRRAARPEPQLDVLGVRFQLLLAYHRVARRRPDAPRPGSGSPLDEESDRDLVFRVSAVGTNRGRRWGGAGRLRLDGRIDEIPAALIAIAAAVREERSRTADRE